MGRALMKRDFSGMAPFSLRKFAIGQTRSVLESSRREVSPKGRSAEATRALNAGAKDGLLMVGSGNPCISPGLPIYQSGRNTAIRRCVEAFSPVGAGLDMFSLQSELRACHRYLRYRSCRKGVLFIRKSTSIAQLCCTLFANSVRKPPAATGRKARCSVGRQG